MKNKDEFVNINKPYFKTLRQIISYYLELNKKISMLLNQKSFYDEIINTESKNLNETNLNIKKQLDYCNMVINSVIPFDYEIRKKNMELIRQIFPELYNYLKIIVEIFDLMQEKKAILEQTITFNYFGSSNNKINFCNHKLIKLDDELKCTCCNATTKDYELGKVEIDFLTLCANEQGIMLKNVDKLNNIILNLNKKNHNK